jgi:hypothetical protein
MSLQSLVVVSIVNGDRMHATKLPLVICGLTAALSLSAGRSQEGVRRAPSSQREQQNDSLIAPGRSLGRLSLGASRETVQQVFPFKPGTDQDTTYSEEPSCGTIEEINWLDDIDPSGKVAGNIFVHLREGRVFQISTSTPRYRTAEGIASYASPEIVKKSFGDLKAYVLDGSGGQMFDFHNFVYWVSREKGIAFQLAYVPRYRRPLVYQIIVFRPNTEFLPDGCVYQPQKWFEIPAYSLAFPSTK